MGSKVLLYYFCHVKESAYSQSDLFRYEDKMKEMKKLPKHRVVRQPLVHHLPLLLLRLVPHSHR